MVVPGPGVDGRAAVAQRQHPGRALGEGLTAEPLEVAHVVTAGPDADVAVRIEQPGRPPPAAADRLRPGDGLEGDPAVTHPQLVVLALGQDDAGEVERRLPRAPRHRPGRSSLSWSKLSFVRSGRP